VNGERFAHKISPDRHRRIRAFHSEIVAVVETDVNDADDFRRETGEPAVARRAGFSGERLFPSTF
jgi:hypothetical protein